MGATGSLQKCGSCYRNTPDECEVVSSLVVASGSQGKTLRDPTVEVFFDEAAAPGMPCCTTFERKSSDQEPCDLKDFRDRLKADGSSSSTEARDSEGVDHELVDEDDDEEDDQSKRDKTVRLIRRLSGSTGSLDHVSDAELLLKVPEHSAEERHNVAAALADHDTVYRGCEMRVVSRSSIAKVALLTMRGLTCTYLVDGFERVPAVLRMDNAMTRLMVQTRQSQIPLTDVSLVDVKDSVFWARDGSLGDSFIEDLVTRLDLEERMNLLVLELTRPEGTPEDIDSSRQTAQETSRLCLIMENAAECQSLTQCVGACCTLRASMQRRGRADSE